MLLSQDVHLHSGAGFLTDRQGTVKQTPCGRTGALARRTPCTKDANIDPAEVSFKGDFLILVDRGVSTDVEIGVPGATAGVFWGRLV